MIDATTSPTIHNTDTAKDLIPLDKRLLGSHKPPTVPSLIMEHVQVALALRGIERTVWLILAVLGVLSLIDVAELASIMWLIGHVR